MPRVIDKCISFTRLFGPASRTIFAVCLLTFVCARASIGPVLLARPPVDELTWVDRSLMSPWVPEIKWTDGVPEPVSRYNDQYYYCIHHPTVVRLIYRWVLHSAGFYEAPKYRYDYSQDYQRNLDLGNYLPYVMRTPLRLTNAVFVWAAVMLIYFSLVRISGSPLLSAAAVVPIICESSLVNALNCVIGYVGTDAVLLFMLALFWLAWLHVKDAGFPGIIFLGLLGGLTAATKYNGAIVLVAAMLYYVIYSRGWRRLVQPLVMGAVAVAVFIALNPIYTADGLPWARRVFADTIGFLSTMQSAAAQSGDYISARGELTTALFPFLPFALPAVAVILDARRKWWFAPTFLWSASIIAGNLAVIMVFLPTYAAPIRIAFEALLLAVALAKISEFATEKAAFPDTPGQPPAGHSIETTPHRWRKDLALLGGKSLPITPATVAIVLIAVVSPYLGELPTVFLSAATLVALACGVWLILRGVVGTAAVLAPVSLLFPWRSCPPVYHMLAFTLAAAVIWLGFLLSSRPLIRRSHAPVAIASALAYALSWYSLVLLVGAAIATSLKPGATGRRRLVAALLGPPVLILSIHWILSGQLRVLTQWDDLLVVPSGVWNLSTLSEAFHTDRYNHMVFKFGQAFFWAPAAAFSIFAWPWRKQWWFPATFGVAALLFAGTLIYGTNVYFQWSAPLQVALLVPFGIIGVLMLRHVFSKKTGAGAPS